MLFIIGIEDVEGIAIRNLEDLAGEGIGRGCWGEKYEEEKRTYTGGHCLIPGIPGFNHIVCNRQRMCCSAGGLIYLPLSTSSVFRLLLPTH